MKNGRTRAYSPHIYMFAPAGTHCNTLQHTATHCNPLQHTATYCSTLQHTASHCNTLQHDPRPHSCISATHLHVCTRCNTLQHTATHCNTLQHTATQTTAALVHIHHTFICIHPHTSQIGHSSSTRLEHSKATYRARPAETLRVGRTPAHVVMCDGGGEPTPAKRTVGCVVNTATHCNTLQHTATHCNSRLYTTHCNAL